MPNEQKAHKIANLNVDWQPSQIGRKKKANHWAKSIKTRSKLFRHISFTLWMAFEHGTFILHLHTIQPHLLCQRKHDNEHFSLPFQNVCQFFTHNVESFAAFPLFRNTFTSYHSRSFFAFFHKLQFSRRVSFAVFVLLYALYEEDKWIEAERSKQLTQ